MDQNNQVKAIFEHIKNFSRIRKREIVNMDDFKSNIYNIDSFPKENQYVISYHKIDDIIANEEVFLRVHFAATETLPNPPQGIAPYIINDWESITVDELELRDYINAEEPLMTEEGQIYYEKEYLKEHENYQDFLLWIERRNKWLPKAKEINEAQRLYRILFDLREEAERLKDTHDLLIGSYLFQSHKSSEKVNHPLVVKNAKIEYNLETKVISVKTNIDSDTQLMYGLFDKVDDLNISEVNTINHYFNLNNPHPFDDELDEQIHRLINSLTPHNQFKDNDEIARDTLISVQDNQYLFLRPKVDRTEQFIDDVIEEIDAGHYPNHILNFAGINSPSKNFNEEIPDQTEQLANVGGESSDILLAKLANEEQLEIIKRLENGQDGVLVQGPPGTGKTHTIANIMGHFLSEGKSVLVTSHTRKALAVLKEKLPEPLQGLAVSLVDDNNRDMENSVDKISEMISSQNILELHRRISQLESERQDIIDDLAVKRKQIITLKSDATKPIVINGKGHSLEELAHFLHANEKKLNYIPGKVEIDSRLPLTLEEFDLLYRTNSIIDKDEETAITLGVVDPTLIILPDQLKTYDINKEFIEDYLNRSNLVLNYRYDETRHVIRYKGTNKIVIDINNDDNIDEISKILKTTLNHKWALDCVVAGSKGENYQRIWEDLIEAIQVAEVKQNESVHLLFDKEIETHDFDYINNLDVLYDLQDSAQSGGFSFGLKKFFNSQFKEAIDKISVNNQSILDGNNLEIVIAYFELENAKKLVFNKWKALTHNTDDLSTIEQLSNMVPAIKYYLNFNEEISYLKDLFISNDIYFNLWHDYDSYLTVEETMNQIIKDINEHGEEFVELLRLLNENKKISIKINESIDILNSDSSSTINTSLLSALKKGEYESYSEAYQYASNVYDKSNAATQRQKLLKKLRLKAPSWASAISNRRDIHGEDSVPENLSDAWKYKQYAMIIDEALATNYNELLDETYQQSLRLREKTAKLAADKAWAHLLESVGSNVSVKQSLINWKQTMKSIGKGTGKRVPKLRREAQRLMKDSQKAIPAWIMPMDQVINTMSPKDNQFDIVIVDEASQSDITALGILFLGKKVIVVGDDKQVSPSNVGVRDEYIDNSIETHLIPAKIGLANRFTHRTSIYDLAEASYDSLMLKEHFRCVPDIIAFSNNDSYDGKIKPLRDASSAKVFPPVISYRVKDGYREHREKRNIQEAKTIAAIIRSAIDQKPYQNLTFGVITMLSSRLQEEAIRNEISKLLTFDEMEHHRILVGNASEFQGDERDVILLSVIDSHEGEGVARLVSEGRGDSTKKRYNVATSRAKDQLWVVHSFDYKNQLQEEDYRRKLIEFAENYHNYDTIQQIEKKSDSPFEAEVTRALIARGFNVEQQHQVGPYSIDIVVEYEGKKIALECDGERYHSTEEQITNDLKRQTVLERVGWQFIRLRGSEYYLNPDKAIDRVVDDLEALGIYQEVKSSKEENIQLQNPTFKSILDSVNKIMKDQTTDSNHSHLFKPNEHKHIKKEKTEVQKSVEKIISKPRVEEKPQINSKAKEKKKGMDLNSKIAQHLIQRDESSKQSMPKKEDKEHDNKNNEDNYKNESTKEEKLEQQLDETKDRSRNKVSEKEDKSIVTGTVVKDDSQVMTPDKLQQYSFDGLSIKRHIGVIVGEEYNVQINFAQWGFKAPNYDISPWSDDMKIRRPGFYLTTGEMENLYNLITDELITTRKQGVHNEQIGFVNADAKKRVTLNYESRRGEDFYSLILWSRGGNTTSVKVEFDRSQFEQLHDILDRELSDEIIPEDAIEPIKEVTEVVEKVEPAKIDPIDIDPFIASKLKREQELKNQPKTKSKPIDKTKENINRKAQKNYEIIEHFGTLNPESNWTTQLNLLSWYGNMPKYDLRAWSRDGKFSGKGVTLTKEELKQLYDLIVKELNEDE